MLEIKPAHTLHAQLDSHTREQIEQKLDADKIAEAIQRFVRNQQHDLLP